MTLLRRALPFALLVLALGGCGDASRSSAGTEPASTTDAPTLTSATAPPTTSAPATTGATAPTSTSATPPATTTSPTATAPSPGGASADEAQPGGAGDEEPIRQPARFTLSATGVRPASVAVAPFLAVALTVVNEDQAGHTVKLVGTDVAFAVDAGDRVERRLPGLRAGTYTLAVDGGRAAASLVVGDSAGP